MRYRIIRYPTPSATPDATNREIFFDNQEHLEWVQVPPDRLISEAIKTPIAPGRTHAWADLTLLVQTTAHGQAIVDALQALGIECIHTFSDGEESPGEAKRAARRRKLAFYKGDARVKVTTVHSFKGWESSDIVLVVSSAESQEDLSEVYVGLSRILVSPNGWSLTVICSAPELAAFGRWVNSL